MQNTKKRKKDNMDTLSAFARGEANRDKEMMVFDWDKAAQLIKDKGYPDADAGLQSDWGYTGGNIFRNGKPNKKDYTYLASTWATPEIRIDGDYQPCYKMISESDGWDEDTKWPKSALNILELE